DCDLRNPAANGACGPNVNPAFGSSNVVTTYDPSYLDGSGKRLYNWVGQVSIQRQITPGTSVLFGFTRRSYGGFLNVVNPALTPASYSPFSVPVPLGPKLPGGGGNTICCFYDINQEFLQFVRQQITLASNYGNVSDVFTGFDLTMQTRLRGIT